MAKLGTGVRVCSLHSDLLKQIYAYVAYVCGVKGATLLRSEAT